MIPSRWAQDKKPLLGNEVVLVVLAAMLDIVKAPILFLVHIIVMQHVLQEGQWSGRIMS